MVWVLGGASVVILILATAIFVRVLLQLDEVVTKIDRDLLIRQEVIIQKLDKALAVICDMEKETKVVAHNLQIATERTDREPT